MARFKSPQCLVILNTMVLLGCMVSYMLRVNLAITIVVMPDSSANNTIPPANTTTCTNTTICDETPTCQTVTCADEACEESTTCSNVPSCHVKTTCDNIIIKPNVSVNTYSPMKQNMIQGSFFWGYVITEIPGGRLAEIIGSRKVIGFSALFASILTVITPVMSDFTGYYGLLVLRLLQGFALGAIFPSLYPLAAKWIPPMDRGKFMSNLLALSLGAAVTYPLCGILISWLGWKSVFYVTGTVGLIWTGAWFWLIYDSPGQHPRISAKEKLRLDSLIGTSASNKVHSVPWKKLLTSGPVWAIVITHTCVFMNYSTLSIQLPTFIDHVFKVSIKKIGFYASLPHLGKYLMGVATGYLTTYILSNNKLSTINTRRLFLVISCGVPAVLMLLQAHTGYMIGWTIFNISLSLTLNGGVTGGHLCGGLDIAPNFSGTIFGLANMLGSVSSSLSAYFVGHITSEAQTFKQWQRIFWMLGFSYIIGLTSYLALGSATMQEWNHPRVRPKLHNHVSFDGTADKVTELKPMNVYGEDYNKEEDC